MFDSVIQLIKEKLKVYSNYVAIIVILMLIVSLVRNIGKTLDAQKRITRKEEKVKSLEIENERLKEEFESVTSDEFIESQLREKLGLVREGEVIVVLPNEETLQKLAPEPKIEENVLPNPNWQKWLRLFI